MEFIDEYGPYINAMSMKGINKISIVGTAATVGNAISHATGRCMRLLPITLGQVLETMRQSA